MTIQEAIERGKSLQRQRAALEPGRDNPRSSLNDKVTRPVPEADRDVDFGEDIAAAPLGRVEFDQVVCEQNKILLTESQMLTAGHAAAAYRLTRGRVLHKIKSGGWSCVGITSPGPGEGKTQTALNLAISIAREKQRVVYLLDLDLRNASVFRRVGVTPPRELVEFFIGAVPPEQILFETSLENLIIGGNSAAVPSASELLASPKFEELIEFIRRRSRGALIIIDLPPVLSTDEALVVAPRLNAMFLVVSEGVTRRDSLAKAVDQLSDFNVAGLILNRSTEQMGANYYAY